MITPQVGYVGLTGGPLVQTVPLTIAALNAIRATAKPQGFNDPVSRNLPPYANETTHPNQYGGR